MSLGPWFGGGGSVWDPFSRFDLWDPWDLGGVVTKRRERDQGGAGAGDDVAAFAHANVDWRETDKAHVFRVDLPGVRKEDLKVQVEDGNILQISGERVAEKQEENDKWHRVERRRGSFSRRFRLPDNVDLDNIRCGLEHGVLTVEVPKREVQEQQRNVRAIDVA